MAAVQVLDADDDDDGRSWGPWSVWKTELVLAPYIREFLTAGTRSVHSTFIDCYAGATRNRERETGRELASSIQTALGARADNGKKFTHLAACELPENASSIEREYSQVVDGREFRVFGGDVNATIKDVLVWWESMGGEQRGPHLGQTFAYVDPDKHSDLSWELIRQLGQRWPRRSRRIEQLILLPLGTMRRVLPVRPGSSKASSDAQEAVDRMFGTDTWRYLYEMQRDGTLTGDDAWRRYSDLFRWRLRRLGYQHVFGIEAVNTTHALQYHLILASDSPIGHKIFRAVCENAQSELPRLIAEERDLRERETKQHLFDIDDIPIQPDTPPARLFDYEPDIDDILNPPDDDES